MNTNNSFIRYFKNPLLGISTSTAYGLPNSLVHLPVILMIPYLGIVLCGSEIKPFLPLYFIIALYIGRDLVVLAYRNYSVPLCIWVVFLLFLRYKGELTEFLIFHSPHISLKVTGAVVLGFILYVILCVQYLLKKQ